MKCGAQERLRSASTAFDRAKAVRKRARALPVTHSLSAPATLMLPALCKELPAGFFAAFDLVCSLPPLPLCRGVSDKTHVSFRTRSAAAAERSKKHTKSSEVPAPPYCSRKVGFPRQFGGQGGKRRSAASGGKSEALSRQRRDWRARRSAGIALPQRWTSPTVLGFQRGYSLQPREYPL